MALIGLLLKAGVKHLLFPDKYLAMANATVDDYDFSTGDAGAALMYNSEAGQIRVGG